MKTGGRDFVDRGKAEKRFRLDEPRSALRVPASAPSFRDYLNALDVAAGAITLKGEFLHANPALVSLLQSRSGERGSDAAPGFSPDILEELKQLATRAEHGRAEADIALLNDGERYNLKVVAIPFGNDTGTLIALTFHDHTHQHMVEQQAKQLLREVDHRVKNTLALVLSISNRTASSAETLDSFRSAFSGRMRALAETHNTLAERAWSSIQLTDILQAELRPFAGKFNERVRFSGTDVALLPRAAIALGLMLHELIANAAKFGALSCDGGHVDVELVCQPGRSFAELRWREEDGPAVRNPTRAGFGQAVITRSLQYSPHGGADLDFPPEGVQCTIRIPMEDLA